MTDPQQDLSPDETKLCRECGGKGWVEIYEPSPQGAPDWVKCECGTCRGYGVVLGAES